MNDEFEKHLFCFYCKGHQKSLLKYLFYDVLMLLCDEIVELSNCRMIRKLQKFVHVQFWTRTDTTEESKTTQLVRTGVEMYLFLTSVHAPQPPE